MTTVYTVKPGESYASIAGSMMGNERYMQDLFNANGGAFLRPGQTIVIPSKVTGFISNEFASTPDINTGMAMATTGQYNDWFKSTGSQQPGKMPWTLAQGKENAASAYNYYQGTGPGLDATGHWISQGAAASIVQPPYDPKAPVVPFTGKILSPAETARLTGDMGQNLSSYDKTDILRAQRFASTSAVPPITKTYSPLAPRDYEADFLAQSRNMYQRTGKPQPYDERMGAVQERAGYGITTIPLNPLVGTNPMVPQQATAGVRLPNTVQPVISSYLETVRKENSLASSVIAPPKELHYDWIEMRSPVVEQALKDQRQDQRQLDTYNSMLAMYNYPTEDNHALDARKKYWEAQIVIYQEKVKNDKMTILKEQLASAKEKYFDLVNDPNAERLRREDIGVEKEIYSAKARVDGIQSQINAIDNPTANISGAGTANPPAGTVFQTTSQKAYLANLENKAKSDSLPPSFGGTADTSTASVISNLASLMGMTEIQLTDPITGWLVTHGYKLQVAQDENLNDIPSQTRWVLTVPTTIPDLTGNSSLINSQTPAPLGWWPGIWGPQSYNYYYLHEPSYTGRSSSNTSLNNVLNGQMNTNESSGGVK